MVDPTKFSGIEAIPAAVDYLNSGKSIGKVSTQRLVLGAARPCVCMSVCAHPSKITA